PRVHGPVVGIDQQTLTARCLAPARYLDDLSYVIPRRCSIGRGTRREEPQTAVDRHVTHWHLLAPVSRCKKRALHSAHQRQGRLWRPRHARAVHVRFLRLTSAYLTETGVEHPGNQRIRRS